jgi:hypothetical protein
VVRRAENMAATQRREAARKAVRLLGRHTGQQASYLIPACVYCMEAQPVVMSTTPGPRAGRMSMARFARLPVRPEVDEGAARDRIS